MSINAGELVSKLNFVISARELKTKNYIEIYPKIPESSKEEEEIVRDLMFSFIKKVFVGSKIRPNAHSFSLRLDSHIHRKASKIRDIFNNQPKWKDYFQANHQSIHRIMRDNRNSFQSSQMVSRQDRDGQAFLYIPFRPDRIYSYTNSGLSELIQWIETEYGKDVRLAEIFDETMKIIAEVTEREERERRERVARELREYNQSVMNRLFKPITALQESREAVDRLFANKFSEWARTNGKAPEYVVEATVQELVSTGLKVKVMAPPNSEEEGWIALPPFEGYVEPEGYEMQGWGKVTAIDLTSERSRNGQSPIVIQEYIYAQFRFEDWKHLLPERYSEILEVTNALRKEAELEIEPWLEQERLQKEAEARLKAAEIAARELAKAEEAQLSEAEAIRLAEEAARAERETAQRRLELAQRLRRQLEEATPSEEMAHEVETVVAQAAEPVRATNPGLYLNSMAIPLERFVAINEVGTARRFRDVEPAVRFLNMQDTEVSIYNFHAPFEVLSIWYPSTPPSGESIPF